MADHHFKFNVDVNVINHLGVGLYSSTPAALTELVANAWDADAKLVTLTVDPVKGVITIEDDGHGMTAADVQAKFLNVGYSRRMSTKNKSLSDSGLRRVMGRKGIGKLAMFALANSLAISSQSKGSEPVGCTVNVPLFRDKLKQHLDYMLPEFTPDPFPHGHGTRIVLSDVLTGLKTTESYLRVKLARRFSVIGDASGFEITLNGLPIRKEDRGFYPYVQFLWPFDQPTNEAIQNISPNLAKLPVGPAVKKEDQKPCVEMLANAVSFGDKTFFVQGYIASVFQPKQLGSKDDSANMISIFANGRVFSENILQEVNSAKYYQNYLVGEIHADFLDDDDIDRATASREAIKKDDPRYRALVTFVLGALTNISDKWDEWRVELGLNHDDPQNAVVLEWLDTLTDPRDKQTANKLMTSIKNAVIHSDEAKNEAAKGVLYKGAIVGFEKLRLSHQLDRLSQVADVLSPEFAAIFASLDNLEETAYAEITRQRLGIIKKFADIANSPTTLEKVAQLYLFDHLWLLDPAWDRVTGRAEMEKTLTEYLKKKDPDVGGARLDIAYRASSGRHIVVELKKPSITSLRYYDLFEQVSKYNDAVKEYYASTEPNKPVPPLDIYVLVAKTPIGFDESKRRALAEVSGRFITYQQLINDAKNAYQQYLDVTHVIGELEALLKRLPG
jgi:Histidine kinase-, DNA gyrase B-, and HSP90-like ATPase